MNNDMKNCSQCGQKDRCGQAYERLGRAKGPNVAWKVMVAFVIPILVFILSLAGADKLLQGRFEDKTQTIVSFLAAFGVTLMVVILIRAVRRSSK